MSNKKIGTDTTETRSSVAVSTDAPVAASTCLDAPEPSSVVLRSEPIPLDTDVGRAFVMDCARNVEGTLSDAEIKNKWELNDYDWAGLAKNAPLLAAVRAERERRVFSGEGAREAAQRHYAGAPGVLNRILTDEQVPPRHRIEAARELRQAAAQGPDIAPGPQEKFSIIINLGADETFVKEVHERPFLRPEHEDGEPS
jgi:hypothetical protein